MADDDRTSDPTKMEAETGHYEFIAFPITAWKSAQLAENLYRDALAESKTEGRDARRREIVFALYFAESYFFEWVRDQVLSREFSFVPKYFPSGKGRPVIDRWKEVTKQLAADGRTAAAPAFDTKAWREFCQLVDYRNGLVHASTSRPETTDQPLEEKPKPSMTLNEVTAGWALGVTLNVIGELHAAAGDAAPDWLTQS